MKQSGLLVLGAFAMLVFLATAAQAELGPGAHDLEEDGSRRGFGVDERGLLGHRIGLAR